MPFDYREYAGPKAPNPKAVSQKPYTLNNTIPYTPNRRYGLHEEAAVRKRRVDFTSIEIEVSQLVSRVQGLGAEATIVSFRRV